jgi:hypothetical protein
MHSDGLDAGSAARKCNVTLVFMMMGTVQGFGLGMWLTESAMKRGAAVLPCEEIYRMEMF